MPKESVLVSNHLTNTLTVSQRNVSSALYERIQKLFPGEGIKSNHAPTPIISKSSPVKELIMKFDTKFNGLEKEYLLLTKRTSMHPPNGGQSKDSFQNSINYKKAYVDYKNWIEKNGGFLTFSSVEALYGISQDVQKEGTVLIIDHTIKEGTIIVCNDKGRNSINEMIIGNVVNFNKMEKLPLVINDFSNIASHNCHWNSFMDDSSKAMKDFDKMMRKVAKEESLRRTFSELKSRAQNLSKIIRVD
ncbi:hypothetical protein ROZALSC1DRAFT_26772 [Rozella allomycis CSF55]|uniref:Uncharacterized protein n=1 Tax=Rozella allomycis (strain CSF55) TaxID=988480 RepID=A0A075AQT2_ROZAC|nr:hypothetical protein O9G_002317 [Rozella allomycis CSF55]RKP21840.1 hypothetical protein ROZALSC1DRAFT_26772 [Rozella allomycis CSF55]|eukprot:EPZ32540.1 hypothetical protein O9G_002317 [Rozella allomycis CSF55]